MGLMKLKTKRKEVERALEEKKAVIAQHQRECNKLQKELYSIDEEIEMLERQKGKIAVTDHAVVRYMERVSGVDVDAIREEIRQLVPSRKGLEGITDLNVFKGSHKLVIKDNAVVTVAPK